MNRWLNLLIGFAFVNITACSSTPPLRHYLLDVALPLEIPTNPAAHILQVSTPHAAPGFDTPAQVYMRSPFVLEHYTQSQWVDTPSRLLLPLIVRTIEASGLFAAVLSATTPQVAGEWRLDTEILRFQQEFLTKPSQVRLVFRVQLLNMVTSEVVATHIFEIIEPTPSEDAQGGMIATNQAVGQFLEALIKFLAEQVT